jgi:hypothetical protein
MPEAAVTAKLEDRNRNILTAIRVLCLEEKLATNVKASYEKLLERHHSHSPLKRGLSLLPDGISVIQVF